MVGEIVVCDYRLLLRVRYTDGNLVATSQNWSSSRLRNKETTDASILCRLSREDYWIAIMIMKPLRQEWFHLKINEVLRHVVRFRIDCVRKFLAKIGDLY